MVIGIIGLLVSILLPALQRARYAALQTQCVSSVRQQVQAQLMYAADYKGKFCGRNDNSPDYQRQGGFTGSPVTQMRGRYMIDTRVMICPVIAMQGSAWSGDSYSDNKWQIGDYGGWDTEAGNVYCAYMWMAGFEGGGNAVAMVGGELPPPMGAHEKGGSDRAIVTHRLNFYFADSLHEICHLGRGLGMTGTPYGQWVCKDMPVGHADGSVVTHSKDDIKPRMTVGGSYPGSPGFPGTYLW